MSRVAVVTVVRGRHDHLARQLRSLAAGTARPDHVLVSMGDSEITPSSRWAEDADVVGIDADPRALPLAAARNLGARRAIERGAETVVFLDVDCLAGPRLVEGYDEVVSRTPTTIWSGPVTYLPPGLPESALPRPWELDDPHPARPAPAEGEVVAGAEPDLFWSLSFAVHRQTWERSGGFCERYVGYGAEDTDFGRQVAGRGIGLGWAGTPRAYHQHHPTHDPPVQHLHDILRNGAVFYERWGRWPMLGWLEAFEARGLVERDGDGWRLRQVPQKVW